MNTPLDLYLTKPLLLLQSQPQCIAYFVFYQMYLPAENSSKLSIEVSKRADGGAYTLTVKNSSGTDSVTINVQVLGIYG